MKKNFLRLFCLVLFFSIASNNWISANNKKLISSINADSVSHSSPYLQYFNSYIAEVYRVAQLQNTGLCAEVFEKAVTGFYNLKLANKVSTNSNIITVVDFTKPSSTKRMWIVDLQKKSLLLQTWVAHGSESGGDIPTHFSNEVDSFQSSLGFYITDNVYMGKHGKSLRLDGMDQGFNNRAHERDIVVHAAEYVGTSSIAQLGRLGRSQGCPAVSPKVVNKVIDSIKGKTVLFVNGNDSNYTSKYLDEHQAALNASNSLTALGSVVSAGL